MMIKSRTGLTGSENRRLCFIFLTAVMTMGILIGSIIAVSEHSFINNKAVFNQFISPLNNGNTLFEIMKNTVISVGGILALIFCTGFFSIGQPLAVAVMLYRGIGTGISVALTYMTFGEKGVYITLLFIVPKILATSVILILGIREALRLSNIIYSYLFKGSAEENMNRYIRLYCVKFFVLLLFVFVTAILDGGLNYFFRYLL